MQHTLERFAEPVARFYVGEIILAFEYLHSKNIIFRWARGRGRGRGRQVCDKYSFSLSPSPLLSLPRDLKPENSMLSRDGHVVLVDFGSAKKLRQDERTSTFVGEVVVRRCRKHCALYPWPLEQCLGLYLCAALERLDG